MKLFWGLAIALLLSIAPISLRTAYAGYEHACCNKQTNISPPATAPTIAQIPNAGAGDITVSWNTTLGSDSTVIYGSSSPTYNIKQQGAGVRINAVAVVSSLVQWYVDDLHTVTKTSDGWTTGVQVNTPAGATGIFYGVAATSNLRAWVVGTSGQIFRTDDGGSTWTAENSGVTSTLHAVKFGFDLEGVAVGDGGVILHTLDGGGTWTRIDDGAFPAVNFLSLAVDSDQNLLNFDYFVGGTSGTLARIQIFYTNSSYSAFSRARQLYTTGVTEDVRGVDVFRDYVTNGIALFGVASNGTSHKLLYHAVSTTIPTALTVTALSVEPLSVVATGANSALIGTNSSQVWQTDGTSASAGPATNAPIYGAGVAGDLSRIDAVWPTLVGANGTVMTTQRNTNVAYSPTITGAHSMAITGLNAATLYSFAVISTKVISPTYWQTYTSSNTYFSTRAPDLTPPSATGFTATAGYSAGNYYVIVNLTSCATDTQSGVRQYNTYFNGTFKTSTPLCPTSFAISSGVTANTTYNVTVRAVNNDGFEAAAPAPVSVTTPAPSFTVGLSKSTMVVTAGGTGDTATVSVTSVDGFSGTVTLGDTVPQGSGTFGSTTLAVPQDGIATTPWTITASGSATPGNYSINVTGTSGSLTASASGTEQVTDFSLGAVSPASATVTPGGSTTFSYPITMTNSSSLYNYNVSGVSVPLTATISYSVSPSSPYTQNGTATRTQNVTVITSASTPTGTYTINESVSYHGKTLTVPSTLTVSQPDFTFTAPGSLALNQSTSANLTTTLTSVNGYAGTITYSLLGFPPPGVTLTFPPAQNLTAGSTLNPVVIVNASATAVSGTVTIRATAGATTHSVMVNINVTAVPDFTIDVNSSKTVTVAQGTNAAYTTQVTATGGFAGSVTESVTFSPTGPIGTFAPQPLTSGNYLGALTIPTGPVNPGTYDLTIMGSGSPGTRQVPGPVTLTVTSNPDFTLAANAPTSQTVAAGASATFNLTATSFAGYTGTVTLSESGIPSTTPPFTVAFTPSSLTPSTSGSPVTLTIATPYDPVGVGSFTVVVTGTDGVKTHTASVTLTVTADTTAPVITSGPTTIPDFTTATVNWGTNEPADSVVEYSTDLSFSSVAALTSDVTAHSVLLSGLTDGITYNYRVKSTNPFGLTTTSPNGTFTTLLIPDTTPPVVSFVAPAGGSTQQGVITITVNATDDKSGVASVEISESGPKNPGGRVLQTLTSGGPNYSITWDTNDPVNGEANGTVTLTARATDAAGNAAAPVSIQIALLNDKTPPAFVLTNGLEVEVTVTVSGSTAIATIHWQTDESSTTAVKYGIEQSSGAYTYTNTIDLKDGLGNLVYGTDHLVQLTNLALNSRYHYQIKSCDASNNCLF